MVPALVPWPWPHGGGVFVNLPPGAQHLKPWESRHSIRMGAGGQGTKHESRRLGPPTSPSLYLHLWDRRGTRDYINHQRQRFTPSCLDNEASIIILTEGVQRASWLVNAWMCQEGCVPGGGMEAPRPSHTPCPTPLFLCILYHILYCIKNKPVTITSFMFCCSNLLNVKRKSWVPLICRRVKRKCEKPGDPHPVVGT